MNEQQKQLVDEYPEELVIKELPPEEQTDWGPPQPIEETKDAHDLQTLMISRILTDAEYMQYNKYFDALPEYTDEKEKQAEYQRKYRSIPAIAFIRSRKRKPAEPQDKYRRSLKNMQKVQKYMKKHGSSIRVMIDVDTMEVV